ncbi:hypothetical protein V495_06036 [Pseudogymnoascus sp. VKM F-4514 (FW-929)]|nr:hypothetical protein V495_06036 [Pseudogymnoascus sp. VKM F-4514 (FW-929)]KFY57542.1 hypothetical protein V497_05485 [Pseudogymnoascus sp. VKM F-4516 (FW-969)]
MSGPKTAFTQGELDAIQMAERISSVFSVLGSFFVIITFSAMEIFRKPINRLVFFATFGNLVTNVATLISRSGVLAGPNSPLCQMQAFIIQMFMPADALWTLSMALNVYLTFFHRYGTLDLRRLEYYYLSLNYGIPMIPALVYVFVETEKRGHIFGDATLWCWVSINWNTLRIATFYGPVWAVLVSTIVIYFIVGKVVYTNRSRFNELTDTNSRNQTSMAAKSIAQEEGIDMNTPEITTHVVVTSESCGSTASRTECKRPTCTVKIETSTSTDLKKSDKGGNSAHRAAVAYFRCAAMFFGAMVITWVPATINRVATLRNPHLVSFPLNFTESLLLPLQGFFNATIYIAISTEACAYLRQHCRRVFKQIFTNPSAFFEKRKRPSSFHALADLAPNSDGNTKAHTTGGSKETAPKIIRKNARPPVKDIQPEELEEYERLHKKLDISPEPGSTAGSNST